MFSFSIPPYFSVHQASIHFYILNISSRWSHNYEIYCSYHPSGSYWTSTIVAYIQKFFYAFCNIFLLFGHTINSFSLAILRWKFTINTLASNIFSYPQLFEQLKDTVTLFVSTILQITIFTITVTFNYLWS